jgi:glycerophosphoryl diester phosphodiesterase
MAKVRSVLFLRCTDVGTGIDRTSADWPYPRLVAHRCGGTLAPENTLAGFDACKRYGYRMVEFDAKLSADDHLFLLHDDTLDRTTNGHGPAAEHTWQELAKLDAGSWRDANIEIKPCPGRDVITGQLVAGAALALWQDQTPPPLLSSFSFEALAAAREAAPTLPRGMLFEAVPDDWLRIVRELECVSLHASHKHLTAERVAEIRAEGLRVLVYTVNDPDRAKLLAQWGVDMICTDRIDMLAHDMLSTSGNRA